MKVSICSECMAPWLDGHVCSPEIKAIWEKISRTFDYVVSISTDALRSILAELSRLQRHEQALLEDNTRLVLENRTLSDQRPIIGPLRHNQETADQIATWLEEHAKGYDHAAAKTDGGQQRLLNLQSATCLREKADGIRRGEWSK